jgi:uncharacterized protein YdeI (YjbR/CyaY-like superfamily)
MGVAIGPGTGVVVSRRDDLPVKAFASREAWERWLGEQHATSKGVWLKIAKKDTAVGSVSYAEALEVAICYGWIDGQKAACDQDFWLQRFTPRKPTSKWSKINRDTAVELIDKGLMQPAGLREVERAQADGRWDAAYAGQRTASVPDDLQRELDRHAAARAFFATLDSRNRYAILYRIQDAKTPETRQRRIQTFVAMLNEGRTIYPSSGGAGPGQRRR